MDTTILQVPISKDLRDRALEASEALGFSSLQETVRIFLKKLALKKIDISFSEPVTLSDRSVKRYDKTVNDIRTGKKPVFEAKNAQDLLDQLNGNKSPVRSKFYQKL